MGYQESFITTTNKKYFNTFIGRIKANGKEYYEKNSVHLSFIVSVKENIINDYTKKIYLKKNKKYVYFAGERHLQKSAVSILNISDNNDVIFNLDIIFSEEINCAKIFDTNKNDDGEIYDGLCNRWIEVKKFEFI